MSSLHFSCIELANAELSVAWHFPSCTGLYGSNFYLGGKDIHWNKKLVF